MSDIVIRPIERIKKKCLCCGNEMELFVYEDRIFVTDVLLLFVEKFSIRQMAE